MAFAEGFLSELLGEASLKLFSTIFKEFELLVGVKEEEGGLESKLQVIRSVIRLAEDLQLKDDSVEVFIEKLKDAAYDLEDLIDEFMAEALRQKAENRDGKQKKVRNFFSTSNPLVFRSKMAHKIQALKKRIDAIVKEKRDFNCAELLGVDIPRPPVSQGRETHSSVNKDEVFGRADEKANVIRTLIYEGNERDVSVIAIVGMGGMGKTTLAKSVFNDQSVVTHFHSRKWIYVSDQEFDVKRLLKKILQSPSHNAPEQQSTGTSQKSSDEPSMEELQTKLQEALSEKKYLLVLDDVWNERRDKWLELASLLRCGAAGSKILVTTRSDEVASIMGTLAKYDLGELPLCDCLSLFKRLAFGDKQELNEKLVLIGEQIVEKCGGVPLAVNTVGCLMYSKQNETEWTRVRDSESWLQDEDTGILPALRVSYDNLTPSLKECFAYCALFSKGDIIDVVDLIRQWIAQGFIQSSDELLEEKGEDCFKTLSSRSFFQDVVRNDDGDMEYCTMHDRVHDLARAVAGNGFAFFGMHNHTTLQKTRHLSMIDRPADGLKKDMEAFKIFDKMRSLIFVGMNSEVNICFRFWRLRLLDIRDSWISYLPKSIGKLKHLRYLDVSFTCIKELPETICNLFNLQTLILNGTGIKKFPEGMGRMISLRNVEFDRNNEQMLNGIGELASLRKLPKFIVGEKNGCGIEELKILNLLKGHLSIERLDNIKNAQSAREASLKEKKYLRSLTLSYGREVGDTPEGNLEDVIKCLEPHSGLKSLLISRYMGRKFPSWMEQINLVELSLYDCERGQHLPQLGRLHSLESLSLSHMGAIEYIVEFDSSYDKKSIFPSLEKLVICDLCNLKGWSIMPNLEGLSSQQAASNDGQVKQAEARLFLPCLLSLKISKCPILTHLPSLVLPALENFEMTDVGLHKIQLISSLLSMKNFNIRDMPYLEGLSSQQAASNDGQVKQAEACLFLPCLLSLEISKCPKLTHFPSLVLPALENFEMRKVGLHKMQLISSYLSKKTFIISDMPSLESWSSQVDDDDARQEIKTGRSNDAIFTIIIENCPKMIDMPQLLPSLYELHIIESNEKLLSSIAHYTSLSSLRIEGFPEMTSLPLQVLGPNHNNIHELMISNFPKLMCLPDWLENLPALKKLTIGECPNLELIWPDGLLSSLEDLCIRRLFKKRTVFSGRDGIIFHSLRKLEIEGWWNLESLYEGLQQNPIPTLQELMIRNCPNLVLMVPVGLHQHWLSSLQDLKIVAYSCMKQTVFPGGDGIVFHSLRELSIDGWENLESLCEGLQQNLIPTLQKLWISDCPNLVPFHNGSQQQCLNSLKVLEIWNSCNQLTSFPGGGGDGITLTSLRMLRICGCENLEHLFEGLKENHIPNLELLDIADCPKLGNLPEWLGNLTSLKELVIRNCPSMNALPTKLQKSSSDILLTLMNCPLLERRIQRNNRDDSAQAAWILPRTLMESLKKTPCINPSSSS